MTMQTPLLASFLVLLSSTAVAEPTNLYFGDTHVHTSWSTDAYAFGANYTTDPGTANRWALGLPVIHPYTRARVRIERPLDFLVVTDHAEFLGMMTNLVARRPELMESELGRSIARQLAEGKVAEAASKLGWGSQETAPDSQESPAVLNRPPIRRMLWSDYVDFADRYNRAGSFTSFIGWEWTSTPNLANLHRVVLTDAGAASAKRFIPYSSADSVRPEDLWDWLDTTTRRTGIGFVAIPHNSNLSMGQMFADTDSDGRPITAEYARTRVRWEPVAEVTQVKGDSETHPALSPDDEFADFETYRVYLDNRPAPGHPADYLRSALRLGLEIDQRLGINPYKLGLIGSTDAHTALASAEETNFQGKFANDITPERRAQPVLPYPAVGWMLAASGLSAVWAEENTRAAIFAAIKRREVYAVTGPRIRLRFFGGWEFEPHHAEANDLAELGYRHGVPMGGDLASAPKDSAPSFLIQAVRDPDGAALDRVQVIKGWVDRDGKAREHVYDVAWSGDRTIAANGRLPTVGNTVDLSMATYTNDIGAAELVRVWRDPDFDPAERAFYYARVLQIPTPRYSLYDALALGIDPAETGYPLTIQERAYSSPIWYTP